MTWSWCTRGKFRGITKVIRNQLLRGGIITHFMAIWPLVVEVSRSVLRFWTSQRMGRWSSRMRMSSFKTQREAPRLHHCTTTINQYFHCSCPAFPVITANICNIGPPAPAIPTPLLTAVMVYPIRLIKTLMPARERTEEVVQGCSSDWNPVH